jgi:prepilin-type N-terminal cleavage/methylation domain-containing protein
MFLKRKENQSGLTLIETLTVVSIIVIMSAIVFGNYKNGNDALALDRAAQKLAQDYRKADEMAVSGRGGLKSFGVYFNTSSSNTSYMIYGNSDNSGSNKQYAAGEQSVSGGETVTMEAGVKICDIKSKVVSTGVETSSITSISISFIPPMPAVFADTTGSDRDISIVLKPLSDTTCTGTKQKVVKINSVGRIDITNQ